jgi:hypothetical protein
MPARYVAFFSLTHTSVTCGGKFLFDVFSERQERIYLLRNFLPTTFLMISTVSLMISVLVRHLVGRFFSPCPFLAIAPSLS